MTICVAFENRLRQTKKPLSLPNMVVIHIKRTEHEQFLFETSCATSNEEVIRELVGSWRTGSESMLIVNRSTFGTADFACSGLLLQQKNYRSMDQLSHLQSKVSIQCVRAN